MINTQCCSNCICLPVCISKRIDRLLPPCAFIVNTIVNISSGMKYGESIAIYFRDLNRELTVEMRSRELFIRGKDYERTMVYYLKTP